MPDTSPSHILVVEDNLDNLLVLQSTLEHAGYQVSTALNGEEALQLLQEDQGVQVDLILSDVMMPGLSGYDLCHVLRRDLTLNELPIVLITAKRTDETDALQGMNAGADDYLVRPVDPQLLTKKIQVLLDRKRCLDSWRQRHQDKVAEIDLREWNTRMLVHDMRNPLSGAMAAISLLEMDPNLTPNQQLLADKAIQCLEKQSDMLEDILATAAAQNGRLHLNRGDFDLGECVREQVLLQEETAAFKRIALDCQGLDGGWRVERGDRRLLGRVVANLLINALKYADRSTTVIVWIGPPAAAPISLPDTEGRLTFMIINEGQPIPASAQEWIFQPFAQMTTGGQSNHRVSGVGLGLCFCQQIIRLHGGQVGVISPLPDWSDRGVAFHFTLP